MKRLVVQRRAMRDLEAARAYYQVEAPHMVGEFAKEVDAEFLHLQRNPGTGSTRYGLLVGMPGLRSWPLTQFTYLIFYFDRDQQIVIARVLHQARDIPNHLSSAD